MNTLSRKISEWFALLIAARASQASSDVAKAREYANRSEERFKGLEESLGTDIYRSFLTRPDVMYSHRQLQLLTDNRYFLLKEKTDVLDKTQRECNSHRSFFCPAHVVCNGSDPNEQL